MVRKGFMEKVASREQGVMLGTVDMGERAKAGWSAVRPEGNRGRSDKIYCWVSCKCGTERSGGCSSELWLSSSRAGVPCAEVNEALAGVAKTRACFWGVRHPGGAAEEA